jgi:hypothetical protein
VVVVAWQGVMIEEVFRVEMRNEIGGRSW